MPPKKSDKPASEPSRRSSRTSTRASTTTSSTARSTPNKAEETKKSVSESKRKLPTQENGIKHDDKETGVKKAKTELAVGDTLPDITLQDEEGNEVKIKEIAAEKGVVIFAYPKASTPGCTAQACGFRDNYAKFTDKDYNVYGISHDPPKANKSFKEKQSLPYHLLSDPKRELISALGATKTGGTTLRSSWIIAKGGVIEEAHLGVTPAASIQKSVAKVAG